MHANTIDKAISRYQERANCSNVANPITKCNIYIAKDNQHTYGMLKSHFQTCAHVQQICDFYNIKVYNCIRTL